MKFAFVTPRYGREIVGGAEMAARMIAERLVTQLGWSVEIFTTRAKDIVTWENEYPHGDETINGVLVHRFDVTSGRPEHFFRFSERLLSAPDAATEVEARAFIDTQGPGCPSLIEALRYCDRDLIAFYPYLYTPTVDGVQVVGDRAVMHPAAHDEPALHLPIFRGTMTAVQGLAFHTRGERDLVQQMFPVADLPQQVVGLGFDEPGPEVGPGRSPGEILGIGDRPYILCLGRVDGLKGTTALGAFFNAYKERKPGPLALALVGPVTAQPPLSADTILTGPVSEADKWSLLRGATAFVSPSPHESFSLVLLEAWSVGIPVMVNAQCSVTVEHCEDSNGGLWYGSYAEFEVALDRIMSDAQLRAGLGERGRRYVDANFRWPVIIDRYDRFSARVMERIARTRGQAWAHR
ncbi:MAG: glycosyltransferase family 4 protein [Acidimicrobiales bacterium]